MSSMKDDEGAATGSGRGRSGPAGIADLFDRLLGDESSVKGQIDRNARALAQSALAKLDVVSRAEFDAQSAVLQRTRARVEALEAELEALSARFDGNSAE